MDAGTSINLKSDVLEKLKNALNDSSYKETIESSSNYNNRLVVERKTRIPFIDSQTGVAQNDCFLWMQKWERMPGITEGQLYSYPVRRWRKKRRSQYLLNNNYGLNVKQWEKNTEKNNSDISCVNGFENTNDNNIVVKSIDGSHDNNDKFYENTNKEDWIADLDDVNDLDNVDNDDIESDYDDEEYTNKKKKKKKNESANSSKKKKMDNNSVDKPYKCDMCGMKYKTRPGLSYHYSHTHSLDVGDRKNINLDEDDSQHSNSSSMNSNANNGINSRISQISNSTSNSPLPPNSFNQSQISLNSNNKTNNLLNNQSGFSSNNVPPSSPVFNNKNEDSKPSSKYKKGSAPSNYCDFCLGNAEINKKTRSSEEMISCSDCGRSAHPTCLQFTKNMLLSVKKYRWQCIECKSCGLCGTSDNDDQLLFCDDCDRGYHMYCLKPPLSEPPEGSWSCHLCIEEYHKPKQLESLNNSIPQTNNLNNTNLATLLSTNNSLNPTLNLNKSSNSHPKLPQQLSKNLNSLTTSESTAEKS